MRDVGTSLLFHRLGSPDPSARAMGSAVPETRVGRRSIAGADGLDGLDGLDRLDGLDGLDVMDARSDLVGLDGVDANDGCDGPGRDDSAAAISSAREMRGTGAARVRAASVLLMTAVAGACGLLGGGRETESPADLARRAEADARIRTEVERRIAAEPALAGSTLRVEVERGEVRLHGVAAGAGALRCASRNAELTPGVTLVIDFAELAPGPAEIRCLAPRLFGGARAAVRDLPGAAR